MKSDHPHILACLENIEALNGLSHSDQESVVAYVLENKDWRGRFNLIHNLNEMLCWDIKNALRGFREVKHASITKRGPFDLELAILRHYIKKNPPHEVFTVLRSISTPAKYSKDEAFSKKPCLRISLVGKRRKRLLSGIQKKIIHSLPNNS